MLRLSASLLLILSCSLLRPAAASAQSDPAGAPVLDTIIIVRENVFSPEEVDKNFFFRTANGLRVQTREFVISRELLFQEGQPYDSARVAESEQNLRQLSLFRHVDIDTARVAGKLAALVTTRDGWSTKIPLKVAAESEGTITGKIGLTETNLLGTGTFVHVAYRKDVDRDGVEMSTRWRRFAGTRLILSGSYFGLSDGNIGDWEFGLPFLGSEDREAISYSGLAADRRILRFRTADAGDPDTTFYQRRAFINRLGVAYAPVAKSSRYLRLGARAEIRREEYILQQDTAAAIPDTVTASLTLATEFRRVRYKEVRFFNGFADEDIDVSYYAGLSATLAPEALGWRRNGIGSSLVLSGAERLPDGFIKGSIAANGLFTSAGLDSGQVVLNLTFGYKPGRRHATVLHASAGLQENPPPGQEFDLGFDMPPRSFAPHSFTGTRTLWGTAEHRWFVWDSILDLFRLGFAAFIDYGGAWYEDQDPRFGGNIGFGLRLGGSRSSARDAGRLDLGYRFGDLAGRHWVLSFGPGFVF
ncbi:MAG: hypothetical protein JSU87_04480 [Gemmatimonadota bacterium]|nr:MAG: hypothetical protein JSU87_04480 [Gemmatimonadota bacterium]